MKLPVVSGRECITALQRVGFVFRRQKGSHMIMTRSNPAAQVSVPDHRELDRGTLRTIIRDAGLTVDQFVALL